MLTIVTTPKPFQGHIDIIQRNALRSWKRLHPNVEIILFGEDAGAAGAARELGLRHEPHIERNGAGMKRLDYMFSKAQALARYDLLCYINCDIILTDDFRWAIERVHARHPQFLMVGRRWDTPIMTSVDYSDPAWAEKIRTFARSTNKQRDRWYIDYFAFSRGVYRDPLPPFVVGTVCWDNWLVWKALHAKLPVVDASRVVVAVHQNHDYSYHPQGKQGVWAGEEAQRNRALAGGGRHIRSIADATLVLRPAGFTSNRVRHLFALRRFVRIDAALLVLYWRIWHPIWFFFLDISRPLRSPLGLRSRQARQKYQEPVGKSAK